MIWRVTVAICVIALLLAGAYGAVCLMPMLSTTWLSFELVFGTLSVLLGFLLTVYTFAIPLLESTTSRLLSAESISATKREAVITLLDSGFRELRHAIILVACTLVAALALQLFMSAEVGFAWYRIRPADSFPALGPTCFLAALAMSLVAVFDVLGAMFNIAEAYLALLRK